MQRSPELEAMLAADEAEVRDRHVRGKRMLGGTALVFGGAALAYVFVLSPQKPAQNALQEDEEFSTATFRPPSFLREEKKEVTPPADNIIQIPEPPPPPPAPQPEASEFNVPPPPTPTPAVDPALPEAEVFPERYRSKQIVADIAGTAGDAASVNGDEAGGAIVAGEDRNSKYLAAASAIADRSAEARQIARIDALIPEGTLIPGILETAINSDLPGQIRAITSQDVYSFDGRRVLIPTGSRLIGEYQSDLTRGQKRIFIVWTRLLRDDGVSVRLNSIGADSLGRSGLTGRVDNKWRERFGSAILLSVVGAGSSYLTGYGSSQFSAGDDGSSRSGEAADLARQTIAQTFSHMANQALAENLKIPPTISVHQGERIFVYVRQDLEFSAMYPDPVEEALKEIKHERGLNQDRFR